MGRFTVKEAIGKTWLSKKFRTRFYNQVRDKVRVVTIRKVHNLNWHGHQRQLSTYFEIETRSVPKYYSFKQRRKANFFGKITHKYDIFLKMNSLSFNDREWQVYLGSAKQWNHRPPQDSIASIYRENLSKWTKEKIAKHRKHRHPYIDVGDYNAQVNGINGDFRFRCAYVYEKYGHLFHKRGIRLSAIELKNAPRITNPRQEFFLPKHLISLFENLINRGILKE